MLTPQMLRLSLVLSFGGTLLLGAAIYGPLHAQPTTWAQRMGSATYREGGIPTEIWRGVDTDDAGNIYLSGTFGDTATFSNSGTTLTSAGEEDIAVAKYSPEGALLWARSFGSTLQDQALANCVDAVGNVYVTGLFTGTVRFGGTTLTSNLVPPPNSRRLAPDAFTVKLNPDGEVLWARASGRYVSGNVTPGAQVVSNLAIPVLGSECVVDATAVIISGTFGGDQTTRVSFDGTPPVGVTADFDGFIVKYDSDGNFQWVQRTEGQTPGATNQARALGLARDGTGDIFVGGQLEGTTRHGSTSLTAAGGADAFIGRLGPGGDWLWARSIGGTGDDVIRGVAGTGGDLVLGGKFENSFNVLGTSTVLTSAGGEDIFVARLTGGGDLVWVRGFGGRRDDEGTEVDFDIGGNVIIAGAYSGRFTFGSTRVRSQGGTDFLIGLLDGASGAPLSLSTPTGGSGNDYSYAVAADNLGNYIYCGFFEGTAQWGDTTLTSAGFEDAVVGKIGTSQGFFR
ncbi:hypothetical protein [Gloeobacter morelensis]|uniref:Beta-propeller repeat protein n=1 Tax=Gloeobacter morelensis MG652769 TaxID=2781736 RepID=A0ABY3PHY4_9CYAN|nr:hypothetical protein [Gloeobacter morelensis]UFP93265.1 hypothetical protein ISF26_15845 [Gloeobacter morelensis MG652769]